MKKLILRRLIASAAVFVLASTVMFAVSRGPIADPFGWAYLDTTVWGEQYRKDRPLPVQYVDWMVRTARFDFGTSSHHEGEDGERAQARTVVLNSTRIWTTAQILLSAVGFAIFTGVPLGVLAAKSPGSRWDKAGRGFAFIGRVVPVFILGFFLLLVLFRAWPGIIVFQGGFDSILPAVSLGWFIADAFFWRTRSAMLEADDDGPSGQAGVNGKSSPRATISRVVSHLISPPRTLVFMPAAYLVAGVMMIETWFAAPGFSKLALFSIDTLDFPVLYAVTMLTSAAILALVFIFAVLSELLRQRETPVRQEDILISSPKVSALNGPARLHSAPAPGPVKRFPVFSAITIALITICAVLGPILAPQDPSASNVENANLPPFSSGSVKDDGREQSVTHVLGTDRSGRDEMSRFVWGAWVLLAVGGIALVGGAAGGLILGTAAGIYGGAIDRALSWILEFTMVVPFVFVLLAFSFRYGRDVDILAVLLLLYLLPTFAAFTRSEIRRIRAARVFAGGQGGESPTLTADIREHLPGVARQAIVAIAAIVGPLILVVSMLGSISPETLGSLPTWGSVFRDSFTLTPGFNDATLILSGVAIVAAVIAANNLGVWLRTRPSSNLK